MKNKLITQLHYITIQYLSDYLLFAPISKLDSILKASKEILETEIFLSYFSLFIKIMNEEKTYPKTIKDNLFKIVSFLETNIGSNEYVEKIKKLSIKLDTDSYQKYINEYELRYMSYEKFINETTEVMSMDNFANFLQFDYQFLASMFEDDEVYDKNYLPKFSMNKEYLSAVKKIINLHPDMLKIKEFKDRIIYQLKYNIEKGELKGQDILTLYVINNYNLDGDNKITIIKEDFEKLIEDSKMLLFQIEKNMFINDIDFIYFYNYLNLIHQVYSDGDSIIPPRTSIYNFIEDNEINPIITNNQRNKLYTIMSKLRKYLSGDALMQFNDYLIRLNNIDTKNAIYELFCIRATNSEYKEFIKKHDMNIINRVNNSINYDFPNLNILLLPDDKYEIEKDNIKYLEYSAKEYLRKYPDLFLNKKVLDRTIEYLEPIKDKEIKKIVKNLKKRL